MAHSATLDTTTATPNDGVLQNFTSIDWNANGAAWVQGFNLANVAGATDNFTLTYQGFASAIGTTSPTPNLYVASPGPMSGGYELTSYATITETATCLAAGGSTCAVASLAITGGNWTVYFDTTPDANQLAGTGFLDGVSILSGNFTGGSTLFTSTNGLPPGSGGQGLGAGSVDGTVTYTNSAYVNPALAGTNVSTSLYFPGQSAPTYTRPLLFNGVSTGSDSATDFVLQADASQNFTVPEPTSVALTGIGLLGLAFAGRRRRKV